MLCHWAKTVQFNHSWQKFKNDISVFVKIKSASAVGKYEKLPRTNYEATTTN